MPAGYRREDFMPPSPPHAPHPAYPLGEELANAISHGLGALLAIVGLVVAVALATKYAGPVEIAAVAIYGAALFLLFLASTLYHAIPHQGARKWLRLMDHSAIYLLIAGTYTPMALIAAEPAWGLGVFVAQWVLAAIGIGAKVVAFVTGHADRFKAVSLMAYLGMGWMIMIAPAKLLAQMSTAGIVWLVAGGFAYTAGAAFYAWERLPYNHAIWHGFVLAGAACQYVAVLWTLVPA